jgi:AcrR family transcriptional regulator
MPTTKERILDSTAELFRRQGYAGTGMKQIAAQAAAPFGSVYHFFPGGKQELGAETIRMSGRMYVGLFTAVAAQSPDAASAVGAFFEGAADTLRDSDYVDVCPIATVALEVASSNEPLREAIAEVFEEWIETASSYFERESIPPAHSRELALTMLSLLEGAFIFARTMRTSEPVTIAGATVVARVREALEQARNAA